MWRRIKSVLTITDNATFAAIAGVLLGVALGYVGKDIQIHDAVTYNNISDYIESLLVQPGYVTSDILDKETPFQQIEAIGEQFRQQDAQKETLSESIRDYLRKADTAEPDISGMDDRQLLSALDAEAGRIMELKEAVESLEIQLERYQAQTLARLSTPDAVILGEQMDTTLKDYSAVINAHRYYSEDFLNAFLPEKLSFEGNVIYYSKEAPERLNVAGSGLIYDNIRIPVYNNDAHFAMERKDYSNGLIIAHGNRDPSLKIACGEKYSTISFTIGHIDDEDGAGRSVSIYYMDNNGEYKESITIPLYMDMPVEQYDVPIYQTRNVRIVASGTIGGYALADVYLVK